MIIGIPVNDQNLKTTVCVSFGRAPYFLIYDTESEDKRIINNNAASSQGGAGIKAAQTMVDSRIQVLLTPRCGENAAEVLKAAGVTLYKTEGNSIDDNIKAFNGGSLRLLEDIHSGFHGQGGQ